MAYIGNISRFLESRIRKVEKGYNVFNYADKPDFSMNELVTVINKKLNRSITRFRIPIYIGILAGYLFDVLSIILRKKFPISSVRIQKFCATTQFDASKAHSCFEAHYSLEEGINKTLDAEFIRKKNDDVEFYTE